MAARTLRCLTMATCFLLWACGDTESEPVSAGGDGVGGNSAGGNASATGGGGSSASSFAVAIEDDGWVDAGPVNTLINEPRIDAFTISLWVSCNDTPASGAGMVNLGPASGGGLQMYWSTETGAPTAALSVGSTATTTRGAVLDYTAWHHLAGVFDGASETASIYVDGTLADTVATGTDMVAAEGLVHMGRFHDGDGLRLDGRLDEVALFDSALTASDLDAIHSAGRAAALPSARAHFRMGDDVSGVGATMHDANNGVEATLRGAATFTTAD